VAAMKMITLTTYTHHANQNVTH